MESLESFWRIAEVVLGIGLVIFAHESGHFLAARLCRVRVEVFSLGFGPKLLGLRRGPTLYQLALVPLGGYVKMAGEEGGEGRPPAPDELGAKTVGQRFLIYSGGVIANVVFALLIFPALFLIGVPFSEPLLGDPLPGSPAWHAGLLPGTRVLSVNGNAVYDFAHIPNEVALGSPEEVVLEVQEPGAARSRTVRLVPEYSEELGFYAIGVQPAPSPDGKITVARGSPAERAGLATGDRLVAIGGALRGLSLDEQFFLATRDGAPLQGRFERDGQTFDAAIEPEHLPPGKEHVLGVGPYSSVVADLRETALVRRLGLERGDRLIAVNGLPVARPGDLALALARTSEPAQLVVERSGARIEIHGPSLAEEDAVSLAAGVALEPDGARIVVRPETPAYAAGLRDGDVIRRIDGADLATFQEVQASVRSQRDKALHLSVLREHGEAPEVLEIDVTPQPIAALTYGFGLQPARYVYRTTGPVEAVQVGVASSWKFMKEAWLALKRILLGHVRLDNVGGIVTIGVVSHSWASLGLAKFLFFLCMLSMNLAFLNVLPIPVLDGGHLFFLLIEKIKGSPVSERVLGYSQIVGLVLIVSLMVYVTYHDLKRWLDWFD